MRETPYAEHHPVDVHGERVRVLLVGEVADRRRAGEDARVEARDLDCVDLLPRRRIGDVEAVENVEAAHLEALALEARADRAPDAALAARDEGLHRSSTTFPVLRRDSISSNASRARSRGNVAPTTGRSSPRVHNASSSRAQSRTTSGLSAIRRPR